MGQKLENRFNTGSPTKFDKVDWKVYKNDTKFYLNIRYDPRLSSYYRSDKTAFWRSFVPAVSLVVFNAVYFIFGYLLKVLLT